MHNTFQTNGHVINLQVFDTTKPPENTPGRRIDARWKEFRYQEVGKTDYKPPPTKKLAVIAFDEGHTFAVAASVFKPLDNNNYKVSNLTIKNSTFMAPTRRHQSWINGLKSEEVRKAEGTIIGGDLFSLENALKHLATKWKNHDVLQTFYGRKLFRRSHWEAEKQRKSMYSRTLDMLLKEAGFTLKRPKVEVIIVLGQQRIHYDAGGPSMGSSFLNFCIHQVSRCHVHCVLLLCLQTFANFVFSRQSSTGSRIVCAYVRLIANIKQRCFFPPILLLFGRQARSLGITVIGIDEYNTSQQCPVCLAKLTRHGMRVNDCRNCIPNGHRHFHRDISAAQCHAKIALSVLTQGGRNKIFM